MNKPARPRVFVTQEGPHDYQPAQRYGDVVFMTKDELSPFASSRRNVDIVADIKLAMVDYIPGFDYLLPAGSPVAIAYVFMLASRSGDTHRVLKWDNRAHQYSEFSVDIT